MLRISPFASRPLVAIGACFWVATMLGCADRATPPLTSAPTATSVTVEGANPTYHTRDWHGKTVTVRVPSQSMADIKGKDAPGTVQGTITRVDAASQQVKVRLHPARGPAHVDDRRRLEGDACDELS